MEKSRDYTVCDVRIQGLFGVFSVLEHLKHLLLVSDKLIGKVRIVPPDLAKKKVFTFPSFWHIIFTENLRFQEYNSFSQRKGDRYELS